MPYGFIICRECAWEGSRTPGPGPFGPGRSGGCGYFCSTVIVTGERIRTVIGDPAGNAAVLRSPTRTSRDTRACTVSSTRARSLLIALSVFNPITESAETTSSSACLAGCSGARGESEDARSSARVCDPTPSAAAVFEDGVVVAG